jgi:hypothetical protein
LKSKLNQRFSRLEEKMQPDVADTILHFADGTMASIPGGEHSAQLLGYTVGAQQVPEEAARELEMIRRSVALEEPGGGLFVELIHALQHSPVTNRQSGLGPGAERHLG